MVNKHKLSENVLYSEPVGCEFQFLNSFYKKK